MKSRESATIEQMKKEGEKTEASLEMPV